MTAMRLEPTTTYFVNEHLTIWPNWPKDWALLWEIFCTLHWILSYYHFMYTIQSESTLYSCLNVKELFAWNKRKIRGVSDCSWAWTHNHLLRKRTIINHDPTGLMIELLWELICAVHLTLFFYHVTYAFQSESTLYICLNTKNSLLKKSLSFEV